MGFSIIRYFFTFEFEFRPNLLRGFLSVFGYSFGQFRADVLWGFLSMGVTGQKVQKEKSKAKSPNQLMSKKNKQKKKFHNLLFTDYNFP